MTLNHSCQLAIRLMTHDMLHKCCKPTPPSSKPSAPNPPFELIIVNGKPTPPSSIGFAVVGVEVLSHVAVDLKNIATRVIDRAREICISKSVNDASHATLEVVGCDARNILCDAVERN
ncbi:hypothetical protein LXL04_016257 [Taraxacum kok-saghyz]